MTPAVVVASASAVGASHRHRHAGNEDAAAWRSDPGGTAVAVADGHSDPRCTRADRGARFAVRAATDLPDPAASDAPATLVDAWRASVADDLLADPSTESSDLLAYGTTVVAGWVTAAGLLVLRIGDGDAVVATPGGVVRVFAAAPAGAALDPDSLASAGAAATARRATVPLSDLPALVCLSTDGVDGAYPDADGLLGAVAELHGLVAAEGAAAAWSRLDPWVRQAAEVSGDDATVVLALVTEGALPLPGSVATRRDSAGLNVASSGNPPGAGS